MGIAVMSFRLILRIGVEVILLGLLAGSLVFVLSKLELKSEFLSRFCCGLLKLEGVSLIGFPSRKLFALAAQFSETQSGHVEYAAVAKLAVNTMRDKVTRKILDRVIFGYFMFLLYIFDACRILSSSKNA